MYNYKWTQYDIIYTYGYNNVSSYHNTNHNTNQWWTAALHRNPPGMLFIIVAYDQALSKHGTRWIIHLLSASTFL